MPVLSRETRVGEPVQAAGRPRAVHRLGYQPPVRRQIPPAPPGLRLLAWVSGLVPLSVGFGLIAWAANRTPRRAGPGDMDLGGVVELFFGVALGGVAVLYLWLAAAISRNRRWAAATLGVVAAAQTFLEGMLLFRAFHDLGVSALGRADIMLTALHPPDTLDGDRRRAVAPVSVADAAVANRVARARAPLRVGSRRTGSIKAP
jgi:hypothetical protein